MSPTARSTAVDVEELVHGRVYTFTTFYLNHQADTYKTPLPCFKGEDPHYESPSYDYMESEREFNYKDFLELYPQYRDPAISLPRDVPDVIVRSGKYAGKPVLQATQAVNTAIFDPIITGISHPHQCSEATIEEYFFACHEIRTKFRGRRFPSGWPPELYGLYCILCNSFHTRFRFENLHPVFRFLENCTVCIRGQGPNHLFEFNIVAEIQAPRSCFEDYFVEILDVAKALQNAARAVEVDHCGEEYFTRPNTHILVFVESEYLWKIVKNDKGVTVGDVLPVLIGNFRRYLVQRLSDLRNDGKVFQYGPLFAGEPHLQAAYADPNESWEHRKANIGDIVEEFENTIAKAADILSGVEAWDTALSPRAAIRRSS